VGEKIPHIANQILVLEGCHHRATGVIAALTLKVNKATLMPEVRRAYTAVYPQAQERKRMYQLARELIGSSDYYDDLWERRARLANIPMLLLWGLKDPTFGPALGRWREAFPQAQLVTFPNAGRSQGTTSCDL
jgi:haloalkane dehalogenase